MRIICLDVGKKRIGVAISDALGIIAQGVKAVDATSEEKAIAEIGDLVRENSVEEIVVGLPLNMDGTDSQMTKDVAEFAEKLKNNIGVPIKMWDERLSSLQIERELISMDVSRAKRKKINDMLSAQIVLQSYLDSKRKE